MVIDDDDTDKKWRTHETEYNSIDSQIISDSTGRIDIDRASLGPQKRKVECPRKKWNP